IMRTTGESWLIAGTNKKLQELCKLPLFEVTSFCLWRWRSRVSGGALLHGVKLDEPCGMALVMKRRCILNCEGENTMYTLPRGEEEKGQWLRFIFSAIPEQYNPRLLLCAVHFTEDCFLNWTQFYCGYSKRLLLKDGAVPTLLSPHRDTGVYVSTGSCGVLEG
ncbi:hypothetical protein GOODEAATRI_019114, partial [Goodea atripinnis]